MWTLAPLPSTTSHRLWAQRPTCTSQRPLNYTSRNPPARTGPWTRMTSSTMTTPSAERSLHHCSLRSEKNQRAVDELTTLLTKVCRPVSRRLSVIKQGDLLVISLIHQSQTSKKLRAAAQKMSKSRFSLHVKKSSFSLIVKQRFKKPNSRPIMREEVFTKWMKLSSLNEVKFIVLFKETNNFDDIKNLFMNNYWNNAHERSLNEMEELKRFQDSTFDTISRRKLVEDRVTILEFTGKIQELQNEIYCMSDSRDFQDAESVRSGQSHVANQPVSFTRYPDPGGMLSRSLGMPSRNNGPPSIWETHGFSGNVFANPTASSSAPYPHESNLWSSNVSEHTPPHAMSQSQQPLQDQRCRSRSSAKNSVITTEGGFSKN